MKKRIKWTGMILSMAMVISLLTGCGGIGKQADPKTELYTLDMPDEASGLYEAEVDGNKIAIYDKDARANDFGGFCFEIGLYENPSDYLPGNAIKKVGELTDASGKLYDVTIQEPSDVQYDFQDQTKADNYMKLYNFREQAAGQIVAASGATYVQGAGTRGEDIYGDVIQKHIDAINSGMDANQYESNGMSSMYAIVGGDNPLSFVGYAYKDINLDGVDELMIGEIAEGEWKGIVYDLYTTVDRVPTHVVSGYDRDRYYICGTVVANEYSGGAAESGTIFYSLEANSSELYPQVGFKYDGYTDEANPYFISYDINGDVWEPSSEEDWNQLKGNYGEYDRFDYTPLSDYGAPTTAGGEISVNPDGTVESTVTIGDETFELSDEETKEVFGVFALFTLLGASVAGIIGVIWYILQVIGLWKVFKKMGEPGWKSLIPFYNKYTIYKRIWTPAAFWVTLVTSILGTAMLSVVDPNNLTVINYIGIVLVVVCIVIGMIKDWKFVRSFGKGIVFYILFLFFEPIMTIVIGFSDDEYIGEQ